MNIAPYIDHSVLKETATTEDVQMACRQALTYGFASVCVRPRHIKACRDVLKKSKVKVAAVIGFPLGTDSTVTKMREAYHAIMAKAQELDVVIAYELLKTGNVAAVLYELAQIMDLASEYVHLEPKCCHPRVTVKAILECCYLSDIEKRLAANLCLDAGVDFLKTSTGFGPGGATVEDVRLLKWLAGGRAKIKAAGGIRDYETAVTMIKAGADRIGTSSGVEIVHQARLHVQR